jgi:hypothetical protein
MVCGERRDTALDVLYNTSGYMALGSCPLILLLRETKHTIRHQTQYEQKPLLSRRFTNKSVPVCLCIYCLFNYALIGLAFIASNEWMMNGKGC